MTRMVPTGIDRRALLKSSVAAGAALTTGVAMPAIAQTRPIKLGYVSPQTGPLAAFAEADNFIIANFKETTKAGIKLGSATLPVEVVVKDSQSNPNRAAQVAKDLIVQDKIDVMLVASTPETTNPVSTQCEIEEVPCISTVAPWQPWFIGRQADPAGGPPAWKNFNYTYHFFWGLEDVIAVFTNMWSQVPTNKSVGGLFPNDGDGNAWGDKQVGFPPVLEKAGYKLTDSGRYQNLTDNFSAQISAFKNANAEIITGVVLPPDFTTFWKQALQQGFRPKVASIGKAILFPVAVEALGKDGNNLSSEVWWSPNHPFKSTHRHECERTRRQL
jgi:branched-chain amino acid transport system substrate-binding protein